jgi:hypothetical protein
MLVAVGLILLLSAGTVLAQSVVINGTPLVTSRLPVNMRGNLMLPMRDVFEALNSEIKWFAAERKIMATRGNTVIELWLDVPFATINGQRVPLPMAPTLLNAATYVPLRFPAEAFGGSVSWDGATRTAMIDIPPAEGGISPPPVTPPVVTPPAEQETILQGLLMQVYETPRRQVLMQDAEGNLKPVPLTDQTLVLRGKEGDEPQPANLSDLRAGDALTVTQGAGGQVLRIVAVYGEMAGTVLAVAGNTLMLADGSTMSLANNLRVLDAAGKATNRAALKQGTEITLFYDPANRTAYEIRIAQAAAPEVPAQPQEKIIEGVVVEVYAAQNRLLLQEANENWRFVSVVNETVISRGPGEGPPKPVTLAAVRPGDVARVVVSAENVTRSLSLTYYEVEGEVAALAAGNLVLKDGTVMRLRDNVLVTDANGNPTDLSAIPAGTKVNVRYDSTNRSVWEIRLPQAAVTPPVTTPTTKPEIFTLGLVEPQTVFKAGDKITLQMRGTPNGQATVTVGRVSRDLVLAEVQPGVYQVALTLPEGPDVRNIAITGVLTQGDQRTRAFTSTTRLTIDSTPPKVTGLSPQPNARVDTANPALEVVYEDEGGSGINPAAVRLWVNGQDVTAKAKINVDRLTYQAQGLKNGTVTAQVKLVDVAGNEINQRWNFTVNVVSGAGIIEASHNAAGVLVVGNEITVTVKVKDGGGTGTWDLGDIMKGLTLKREGTTTTYRGTYTIKAGEKATAAPITVRYKDPAGQTHTLKITNPVAVNADLPHALAITAPLNGAKAPAKIVVSGEAPPNSRVQVTITYTTRVLTRITGELWKGQVTASAAGKWQTLEVESEIGFFGRADSYAITAELLDAEGKVLSKATVNLVK